MQIRTDVPLLETNIPCNGIGDIVRVVVSFRVGHVDFVVWIETKAFWADREIRYTKDNWRVGYVLPHMTMGVLSIGG